MGETRHTLLIYGLLFTHASLIFDPETPSVSPYLELRSSYVGAGDNLLLVRMTMEVYHNDQLLYTRTDSGLTRVECEVDPVFTFAHGEYLNRTHLTLVFPSGKEETLTYEEALVVEEGEAYGDR